MSKNNSTGKKVAEAAAGLATLAAAAAGTYYFFGSKKAAAHRKSAKAWAEKAKKEVVKEVGSLEKVSKATYESAVAQVMKKYHSAKAAAPAEIAKLHTELKGQWKNIEKHLKPAAPAKKHKPAATKAKAKKK